MTRALQWKLVAGFVLVFIAGGVTGGFFAAAAARNIFFGPTHHGIAAERMRERLRAQLNLTPEQVTKISPIIDKAGAQLEQIRTDTGRRVHETFAEAHREMAPTLSEEQRAKLEKLRQRHHRWLHRMHGEQSPEMEPAP